MTKKLKAAAGRRIEYVLAENGERRMIGPEEILVRGQEMLRQKEAAKRRRGHPLIVATCRRRLLHKSA